MTVLACNRCETTFEVGLPKCPSCGAEWARVVRDDDPPAPEPEPAKPKAGRTRAGS